MNRCAICLFILTLLFLNGCCSSCHRFWENVERGDFYDETLQNTVETSMARSAPDRYKVVARVILNRSGGDQSFTLMAKIDREQRKISIAGLADLGTVIFAATMEDGTLALTKDHSGWGEQTFQNVFAPLLEALFFPLLTETAIVQSAAGGKLMHRSRRSDGSIRTYVFDQEGSRWVEYHLMTTAFFGEIEKIQRVRFSSFNPVKGWDGRYPFQIDIDDEIHGYKARVTVRTVTVN